MASYPVQFLDGGGTGIRALMYSITTKRLNKTLDVSYDIVL